ncbi:MAG TPA: D-glycero-beta-D-manno-heptose-7-phosphate kinase [Casimicrobiaceae bacterium]|nr:D-glycero-beta-D-manno-heptose-7-phosphate kinase [Casimicrobiaceae bacterium]
MKARRAPAHPARGETTPSEADQGSRAHFSAWRARVADAKVLIVGDVMLDRYWFGDVDRISPEAPVPVVKIARSEERPGGAANVARNVAALGARAMLLSATGRDEPADALMRLLDDDRIETSFLRDETLRTTVKLRVIGRQQQLLRIDFETPPPHELLASHLVEFDRFLAAADALVLSDYGKGGLAHIATMIERGRAAGKPVLVDPKGDDWDRYRGATLITPNRSEFRQVAGRARDEDDLARRAQGLRRDLNVDALLVTRSEEGMSLFSQAGALTIPTQAREVFDVSGAGDTVIATLGTLLAAGASLADATAIANEAAGVVVGKLGTAVAEPDELS